MSDWDVVATHPAAQTKGPSLLDRVQGAVETAMLGQNPITPKTALGVVQGVNDVVRSTLDPAAAWLDKHVPLPQAVKTLGGLLPTAAEANAGHDALAQALDRANAANPQAPIGRTVGQGVALAPLMAAGGQVVAPLKAAPVIGPAVQFLSGEGGLASRAASGAIQGAAGAAGTHKASDAPLNTQVALGALLGGGLPLLIGGARAAGAGLSNLMLGGQDQQGRTLADRVAMFDQAGVDPTLAATGGPGAATLGKASSENAIAGFRARGNMARSLGQTADAASERAGQYGGARPPSAMGEQVQSDVTRYSRGAGDLIAPSIARSTPSRLTTFGDKSAALYNRAEALIGDTNAPIDLTNTRNAIAQVQSRFVDPNLGQRFANPTLEGIASDLDAAGGKAAWNDAKLLRSNIRERLMADPQLRGTLSDRDVNSVYGALTEDLKNGAAQLGGPAAEHAYAQANQFHRAGMARLDDQLSRIFNAPSGESAYDQIVKAAGSNASADIRKLSALKQSLPADTWGDVASTVISRLGQPNAGNAAALEPGAFSVNNFVTNYAKLSPMGRQVLFGGAGNGELKSALDNLAQVAGMQKAVEAAANHSHSGVNVQTIASIGGLLNPHTTVPTAGALVGIGATGEAMTNPGFVRWLAGFSKSGATPEAAASLKALAASDPRLMPVYVNVVRNLMPQKQPDQVPAE